MENHIVLKDILYAPILLYYLILITKGPNNGFRILIEEHVQEMAKIVLQV